MAINFKTNIAKVAEGIQQKLLILVDADDMTRTMASTATALIRDRVHEKGLAADGTPIGTYSEGYMKVRTGDYGNSGVKTKGKNAGEKKDSGAYTKGAKAGSPRPRYNRSTDTKVILSLTRQMENDLAICATDPIKVDGGYGIGFQNKDNFEKARWCEDTYKKSIYRLTSSEKDVMDQIRNEHIKNALS
ncbi:hypothetical protein E3A20_21440 [Planctomyces bekefii]|uniref:Uncharacterized protein n=1 Tax=Planctomyces bekefii TaxID=1653850 RepID=A0A5C6M274_9PLAN|nr:hypothetical protein E3A20_21440 [Planctomyces bekefii]